MQCSGLDFSYKSFQVFKDFEFESEVPLILFMGPSGCGKTTLLKILFGSLHENLSYRKLDLPPKPYLVLQDDALCPWLTGRANITRFIDAGSDAISSSPLYEHVRSFIDKRACLMSFGQRRMVELLRAFIYKPGLLLLDEPFNYLDKTSWTIVLTELAGLMDRHHATVVMSSHYREDLYGLKPETYLFPEHKPISRLER